MTAEISIWIFPSRERLLVVVKVLSLQMCARHNDLPKMLSNDSVLASSVSDF
jgi:hypothetical protein